jgi:hypothetical protein
VLPTLPPHCAFATISVDFARGSYSPWVADIEQPLGSNEAKIERSRTFVLNSGYFGPTFHVCRPRLFDASHASKTRRLTYLHAKKDELEGRTF